MRGCVPYVVQNDFCLPDAVLCVKGAMGCLPNVIDAVDAARARGIPVVWVIREHDPEGEIRDWWDHGLDWFSRSTMAEAAALTRAGMSQALHRLTPRCAGIDVELFRSPMFKEGKSSTVKGTPGGSSKAAAVFTKCSSCNRARSYADLLQVGLLIYFCLLLVPGAALVAGLEVRPGERVIVKKRFSAFFDTDLHRILQ